MKILLYDKFEIETSLTLEETIEALKGKVEPKRWLLLGRLRWFLYYDTFFVGDVSCEGFRIIRNTPYQWNPINLLIRGTFKESQNGTNVMIRMGLHPFIKAFLFVWFSFASIPLFSFFAGLASGITELSSMLVSLSMLIFASVLVSKGFWFAAREAKPELLAILQEKIKS